MALKKMTIKYWNSLEEGSRYRALKAVMSNFSESTLKGWSRMKAKELGFAWKIVADKVKQSGDNHYKTVVNGTYMP